MFVRRLLTFLLVLACANVLVFVAEVLFFTPFRVPTGSMQPALRPGDRIGVAQHTPFDELQRGDLIVFVAPPRGETFAERSGRLDPTSADAKLLVKRVVALPRESIQARLGVVAINDTTRLEERYVRGGDDVSEFTRVQLGNDELFVMGDNRDASVDSRDFGAVPETAVLGKVVFRYWPPARVKVL